MLCPADMQLYYHVKAGLPTVHAASPTLRMNRFVDAGAVDISRGELTVTTSKSGFALGKTLTDFDPAARHCLNVGDLAQRSHKRPVAGRARGAVPDLHDRRLRVGAGEPHGLARPGG